MKNFLFYCGMCAGMCCGAIIGVIIAPPLTLSVLWIGRWLDIHVGHVIIQHFIGG